MCNCTFAQVQKWTQSDLVLFRVKNFTPSGWPWRVDEPLKPFFERKNDLSLEDGCILSGSRVVIPPQGRDRVLEELHQAHPGSSRMKVVARSYVWWPKMDQNIETYVGAREICAEHHNRPAKVPVHPWEFPVRCWSRIHVDYLGLMDGEMVLVTVDSFSKWIEADVVSGCTVQTTIRKLRHLFAAQGLPDILVSDNSPCFTSSEFRHFTSVHGIRHLTSAPYHPSYK